MALSLRSGNNGRSPIDYRTAWGDSGVLEFNERAFRRALLLEIKRTAISKRPFILMLVSLAEIPAGPNENNPRKKVVASVASAIRDTDVLGWYKSGLVLGILFTEIGDSAGEAVDSIIERVNTSLASCLSTEEMKKLSVAVYLMPKEYGRKETQNDAPLYGNLHQSGSSKEGAHIEGLSFH